MTRLSRYNEGVYHLRDYQRGDFEELHRIDSDCFRQGIAYSRSELQSYVERKHSFCIIAEAATMAPDSSSNSATATLVGEHARDSAQSAGVAAKWRPQTDDRPRKERVAIAGFVIVELHREGYGHVITLDVRRDFRRQRLGTLLMQAAEERIRKLGGFMMVLEAAVDNGAALAFYERQRYKVLKRLPRYYAHNLDALFLTKRL
jgi:ribosomal protein S18 acetylase RimI-like enzyme